MAIGYSEDWRMRQGLFQRKGATSALDTQPSPMSGGSSGKKPNIGANGSATDTAPVRTSNTGSQGPGDQGSADDGDSGEIVQCPNCGCQFDADDPTNPDSYVPPEQAPDGSPSQMGSQGAPPSGGSGGDLSAMLSGLGAGGSSGPGS